MINDDLNRLSYKKNSSEEEMALGTSAVLILVMFSVMLFAIDIKSVELFSLVLFDQSREEIW